MAKPSVKRTSESVVNSRGEVDLIRNTLTNYRPRINENIAEIFAPFLAEGESPPDLGRVVELALKDLDRLHAEVLEADKSRIDESVQQTLAKQRVDEAETALRRRIRMIRTTIEDCFGEDGLLAVPFRSADAGSIDGLLDQTDYMEESLRRFTIPDSHRGAASSAASVMPPPEILADSIKSRKGVLREAYDVYSLERQERRAAQLSRRAAMDEFARSERRTRALLKAIMNLADLEEFAQILRVSRATRPPEVDPVDSDDPPTTEGDPPLSQAA